MPIRPYPLSFSYLVMLMLLMLAPLSSGCRATPAEAPFKPAPLAKGQPVRGWTILSDSLPDGLRVIERAPAYDINHLQISHHVIHDLRHVRDPRRLELAQRMTEAAHEAGIQEVVLWDRTLYGLGYYPERFRTGPNRTIDLDNPEFWAWFKDDYRQMLDKAPNIQGLILTFIETGARVERQHSEKMLTNQEKLAAAVNAVADVVIGERGLNLYARTFSYDDAEYENIVGAIELYERPEIRLMMKESPHDFFLTHPSNRFAGAIPRPTIVEFDTAGEFNGQGMIANTWPGYILDRWRDFLQRDHIVGYVARTDRYGDTRIIDRPSEINLLALKRYFEDRSVDADRIYREFIVEHYGEAAYPHVRAAFENAFDIVTATMYTLGTNVADHSRMDFDPYRSSYARHVSGKWIDPPIARVGHGVDREFHYWKDVIDHIAPPWAKRGGAHLSEIPDVVEAGWLTEVERMNEQYLRHIITQKEHGVDLAERSLDHIRQARPHLSDEDYESLYHHFNHTLLTARLYRGAAAAYWGFRTWCRGGEHQTEFVTQTTRQGLLRMKQVAQEIRDYPIKPPTGQWEWISDAQTADRYWRWIVEEGWPERTRGFETGMGGKTFPLEVE
ncbi:MAG: hypothetical protein JJU36_13520 [Phycisphaeraceae bacterium]|nr:hypothetical protein [Phycisphaeraceae bacterium]